MTSATANDSFRASNNPDIQRSRTLYAVQGSQFASLNTSITHAPFWPPRTANGTAPHIASC
eukprot:8591753-Lingulodinium_polyedra.AAC.1